MTPDEREVDYMLYGIVQHKELNVYCLEEASIIIPNNSHTPRRTYRRGWIQGNRPGVEKT